MGEKYRTNVYTRRTRFLFLSIFFRLIVRFIFQRNNKKSPSTHHEYLQSYPSGLKNTLSFKTYRFHLFTIEHSFENVVFRTLNLYANDEYKLRVFFGKLKTRTSSRQVDFELVVFGIPLLWHFKKKKMFIYTYIYV